LESKGRLRSHCRGKQLGRRQLHVHVTRGDIVENAGACDPCCPYRIAGAVAREPYSAAPTGNRRGRDCLEARRLLIDERLDARHDGEAKRTFVPRRDRQLASAPIQRLSGADAHSFASPSWRHPGAHQSEGRRASRHPAPVYYQLAAAEYGSAGNSSCNSDKGQHRRRHLHFYDSPSGDRT